jgi:hypothetical protein
LFSVSADYLIFGNDSRAASGSEKSVLSSTVIRRENSESSMDSPGAKPQETVKMEFEKDSLESDLAKSTQKPSVESTIEALEELESQLREKIQKTEGTSKPESGSLGPKARHFAKSNFSFNVSGDCGKVSGFPGKWEDVGRDYLGRPMSPEEAMALPEEDFLRLFDIFRTTSVAQRGWVQVELLRRFPEFKEFLRKI